MRSRSASTNVRSMMLQGQAALLALVFVAGQLGSLLHAVSERHARCPEHGELVHVDALPLAAATGPMAATAATGRDTATETDLGDADALRGTASTGEGHEHDHCYLCPVSRERLGPVPNTGAIAAVTPAEVAHSLPAVVAPSGRRGYVIAPKTSPPV
jgi:hypothetical protein